MLALISGNSVTERRGVQFSILLHILCVLDVAHLLIYLFAAVYIMLCGDGYCQGVPYVTRSYATE